MELVTAKYWFSYCSFLRKNGPTVRMSLCFGRRTVVVRGPCGRASCNLAKSSVIRPFENVSFNPRGVGADSRLTADSYSTSYDTVTGNESTMMRRKMRFDPTVLYRAVQDIPSLGTAFRGRECDHQLQYHCK
jgi:hypothetical protein